VSLIIKEKRKKEEVGAKERPLYECGALLMLQYILETNAYPREHEQLKELREATVQKYQIR